MDVPLSSDVSGTGNLSSKPLETNEKQILNTIHIIPKSSFITTSTKFLNVPDNSIVEKQNQRRSPQNSIGSFATAPHSIRPGLPFPELDPDIIFFVDHKVQLNLLVVTVRVPTKVTGRVGIPFIIFIHIICSIYIIIMSYVYVYLQHWEVSGC